MPMQNVDYKCELRDPDIARALLRRLGGVLVGSGRHEDIYYRVPDGRVKRRAASGEPVEWIVYHRTDRILPRISRFTIYTPEQMIERYGERPLPEWVRISKDREIWLHHGVRVHIDHVHELGWFLEIDALVSSSRNVVRCHELIHNIRAQLQPTLGGAIATSYADLVALEKQLGDEGNVEEPDWFRHWQAPDDPTLGDETRDDTGRDGPDADAA